MKVSELIKYLEDCDPDLPVYVASSDSDYDWMALYAEHISVDYVTDMSEDLDEPMESMALCLGDGYDRFCRM
jgi:hypothetical protein